MRPKVTSSPSPASSSYKAAASDSDDYQPGSPVPKRRKIASNRSVKAMSKVKQTKSGTKEQPVILDIEDVGFSIRRPHGPKYHHVGAVAARQQELLDWFEGVREIRGMPWRKRYDHTLSMEEKGQRAYEVWVSEVMLQQTQVNTVIDYWRRWMERWPTIADLAKADIEEVNAAWRGLGYYRRARSLLAGAKTVMKNPKYNGRLPRDPGDMEKEIDGVGRYTAGAISSMAYGIRAPIVDGNVHRLFTRLLGVHAPQTVPATIKFLWTAAEELVEALPEVKGVAGDWNQTLMELGSQVCKPVSPDCQTCPLRPSCKAFSELSTPPPEPNTAECELCAPVTSADDTNTIPSVTVFPMKKEKKVSREEEEVVCVVEWYNGSERKWLFVKRPEKGLLAGLFEPPTTPISPASTPEDRYGASLKTIEGILDVSVTDIAAALKTKRHVGAIPHIFSHINMTYHILHLTLSLPPESSPFPPSEGRGVWLDSDEVESANVGTGVKKVWAEVYGSWGSFEQTASKASAVEAKSASAKSKVIAKAKVAAKAVKVASNAEDDSVKLTTTASTKLIKKIVMMPMMPKRSLDA